MIQNKEKLVSCDYRIKKLCEFLEKEFKNIIITSGYRSPEYNATLPNASKKSQHCLGLAVDLVCPGVSPIRVASKAMEFKPEIKGLGIDIFKYYCHIDYRDSDNLVLWVYGRDGLPV